MHNIWMLYYGMNYQVSIAVLHLIGDIAASIDQCIMVQNRPFPSLAASPLFALP